MLMKKYQRSYKVRNHQKQKKMKRQPEQSLQHAIFWNVQTCQSIMETIGSRIISSKLRSQFPPPPLKITQTTKNGSLCI